MGGVCSVVPLLLALSGAFRIQVVAAAAGAAMATAGVAFGLTGLPRRLSSDLHSLLAAFGFFLLCGGVVLMLAYH